jgi:type I restriction-modification system DNA methylase subunit
MNWRLSVQRNSEESPNVGRLNWILGVDLAKELNVKPPVLGNWRNRYSDFPPTMKSESGQFLYNREEVLLWSKSRDRESKTETQIWNLVNSMRGSLDEGEYLLTGLAMLTMIKLGKKSPSDNCKNRQLAKTLGETGKALLSAFDLWDYRELNVNAIWNKFDGVNVEDIPLWLQVFDNLPKGKVSEDTTAESINELIAKLVEHVGSTVFDPAVGQGRTLLGVAKGIQGNAVGQEINQRARELCLLRAFLLGVPANIRLGDSLTEDAFSAEQYEVIVCDPPMNYKLSDSARAKSWPFGQPRTPGDWAWAQLIVMHLTEMGEGYLSLSSGALFHRSASEIRRELIRRGCIEVVISLPPLATSARIPIALICLRAPDIKPGADVLLIDASNIEGRRVEEFLSNIPDVVGKVQAFRKNPAGFVSDDRSVIVSVLDLLEGDCSLVPSQYIARSRKSEAPFSGELRPLLLSLQASTQNIALRVSEIPVVEFELNRVSLKTLRLKNMAQIIAGVRIASEIQTFEIGGKRTSPGIQPVLTVKILRAGGPLISNEFIEDEQIQPRAVTQPGDIVITRIGEWQAKVDAVGGNLILAPLSILRLDSKFDPYVVAAALNSDHVRKFKMGSVIGHINLDLIEIPQISIEQAQVLRKTFMQIEQLEANVAVVLQRLAEWHKTSGEYLATASEVNL